MTGRIRHRILLNYRIDAEVARRALPDGFRPLVVKGAAVGGICQVSLERMHPRGVPAALGVPSHNAAHHIAVVLDAPDGPREGVYIPRRDTTSPVDALAGGRFFPGVCHRVRFAVEEQGDHFRVAAAEPTPDGAAVPVMRIDASVADAMPAGSIFADVAEASRFFAGAAVGWSPTPDPRRFDAIELRAAGWRMHPLAVAEQASSYFGDEQLFPPGAVEFDSALVMRDLEHSWVARGDVCTVCA